MIYNVIDENTNFKPDIIIPAIKNTLQHDKRGT